MSKRWIVFLLAPLLLFCGCGGDEETKEESEDKDQPSDTDKKTANENDSSNAATDSSGDELVEEEPEPPDPNGIYLPSNEKLNGEPVYTTKSGSKDDKDKGYFLWFR